MNWWLPPQASTFAPQIDGMFTAILVITGITFFLVEIGLIWFIIAYRERPGRKAHYTHGNHQARDHLDRDSGGHDGDSGHCQQGPWVKIKGRNSVPANAYPIGIHAKQFEWWITYPGPDGKLGRTSTGARGQDIESHRQGSADPPANDDMVVRNQMHIPVGRPVVAYLSAEDVIHSFYVPSSACDRTSFRAW
jgi:cytochrome c oxidase subunit 2